MKRKIEFRCWGYTSHKWFYYDDINGRYRITPDQKCSKSLQFTGLRDRGNTKIFEGDLLNKTSGKDNHVEGIVEVRWHGAGFGIFINNKYVGWLGKDVARHSKVIGNTLQGLSGEPESAV